MLQFAIPGNLTTVEFHSLSRRFSMEDIPASTSKVPWNKGKIVGQKAPLRLKDIWAIRIRLQLGRRTRELALFDLGKLCITPAEMC
jgi:hypothetical protein